MKKTEKELKPERNGKKPRKVETLTLEEDGSSSLSLPCPLLMNRVTALRERDSEIVKPKATLAPLLNRNYSLQRRERERVMGSLNKILLCHSSFGSSFYHHHRPSQRFPFCPSFHSPFHRFSFFIIIIICFLPSPNLLLIIPKSSKLIFHFNKYYNLKI